MILDQHDRAGGQRLFQRTGGIGEDDPLDAQALKGLQRGAHGGCVGVFVIVAAARQHEDRLAAEISGDDFRGMAVPNVTDWQFLNLKYDIKARIDQDKCIKCGLCHIACEDTSHQAITAEKDGARYFDVVDSECVGCNLCVSVCPVEDCITMERMAPGRVDPRTGKVVEDGYANWTTHPNNPNRVMEAAE